jgi:Uncharacterized protein conserved in bacteria
MEHDPFNEPETAHPRARELMPEEFFWHCEDEEAPFGSDEGSDGYYEFRRWRSKHPSASLVDCLSWIMEDQLEGYTSALFSDQQVEADLASPEDAFLADAYDMFTLDATVIATGLGQLLDEGHIDSAAKPYLRVALSRQLHPKIVTSDHRRNILLAVQRVVEAA